MKQILLSLFFISLTIGLFGQSKRTVLMEEFTQASCPPCEATTPALNAIMNANPDDVVQIRYQTSWPGVDPMNADNPEHVQTRVDYYGVNGVPNFNLDGSSTPGVPTQSEIDNSEAVTAPVLVTVEHTLSADLTTMDVTVRVVNESANDYSGPNDFLRVALVEEEIAWPFTPGSTSITTFEYVMKTFFTGPEGMEMPDVAAGETWEMTWETLAVPTTIYNYSTLGVVAFIQDDTQGSNRVINAGISHPQELTGLPDYAVSSGNTGANDVCEYGFEPKAFVRNAGNEVAPPTEVAFFVNGILVQTEMTPELAALDVVGVDFAPLDLPAGNNVITYVVNDYNQMNNNSTFTNAGTPLSLPKVGAGADAIVVDLESDAVNESPSQFIVDSPVGFPVVDAASLQGNSPLGGFGDSENSILVPFWVWQPAGATGSMIAFEKLLVSSDASVIEFDYAFTTWGGSADMMAVEVSNDCGATYETVWQKSGSAMATAPELNQNQAFFLPNASQWKKEKVDISAYMGEELIVRFFFTSGYGDMLYLDNINSAGVSSLDELDQDESISVYPNPAVNQLTLDMNINEVSDVNIRMVNILGEVVLTDKLSKVTSSKSTIDVSGFSAGSYFLYMTVGDKEVVRRVNVTK